MKVMTSIKLGLATDNGRRVERGTRVAHGKNGPVGTFAGFAERDGDIYIHLVDMDGTHGEKESFISFAGACELVFATDHDSDKASVENFDVRRLLCMEGHATGEERYG